MSMDSIPPSKGTGWQTGLKGRSNNLLFTRDPSFDRNKHWLRVKGWKKITKPMAPQKRQE
jgi:hypothetical protein